ncbi:MAG: chemotaxis protein [Gammaproteobacteria bacterium]|nr:MAG: chemotaxis protein [Gammaproteobacteria bacterium]
MKVNMPVTDNEVLMKEGAILVSTTDLKGVLTEVNEEFELISGFSKKELIGKSHNMVRHPDMPAAAFEDLWVTIKQGRPWQGIVKNRCKNGDYYWVEANVLPITRNGQVTGYMSVRYAPSRQQVNEAEALYRQLNSGNAKLEAGKMEAAPRSGALAALFGGNSDDEFIQITRVIENVLEGNFQNKLDIKVEGALGDLNRAIYSMQAKLNQDLAESKAVAKNAGRIKEALDKAAANVMLADRNYNIIYMNDAAKEMFQTAESEIRKALPSFDASQLVGTNIDVFHKNPAHQRGMLDKLAGKFESELTVSNLIFKFIANPVLDADGVRIGTVVEWEDRTAEVATEHEISNLVEAVSRGDLSGRFDLQDKKGFFKTLGEGINQVVTVVEESLAGINTTLAAIAEGDLTQRLQNDSQGAFAEARDNLNSTQETLSDIFGQINMAADFINTASQEIASGNDNLSQRVEEQASSLEETASGMEEMTSTVQNNAENTRQAKQLSNGAREIAEKGGEVVSRAVGAMNEINVSSNKIADIIGVIDEIAFQTNLLALNASVEAARAGEHGRGFAVVATEVRNLAQRSATAAKESKELIQSSVESVKQGSRLVSDSGKTLEEIVTSVRKVGDIVTEIAAASDEQSAGIGQINQAVSQMDEITQQNAALAEEASAASLSMKEQADTMIELMSFFKTDVNASVQSSGQQQSHGYSHAHTGKANSLDFTLAKSKHLAWKGRLRDFLDGKGGLTMDQAVSHRDCDLGTWLYSSGMSQFGHMPDMQSMEEQHQEMHSLIKGIIASKEQGNMAMAEGSYKRVEQLSGEIVSLLGSVESVVKSGGAGGVSPAPARQAQPTIERAAPALVSASSFTSDDEWEEF